MSCNGNLDAVPLQLPTPRSSQSPRKTSSKSRPTAEFALSPVPTSGKWADQSSAPPTPLSPSKRRINGAPFTPDDGNSPMKKARSVQPPITGQPATPGRGNLFASPSKVVAVRKEADEWEDEEVFGTPGSKNKERKPAAGKENAGARRTSRSTRGRTKVVGAGVEINTRRRRIVAESQI